MKSRKKNSKWEPCSSSPVVLTEQMKGGRVQAAEAAARPKAFEIVDVVCLKTFAPLWFQWCFHANLIRHVRQFVPGRWKCDDKYKNEGVHSRWGEAWWFYWTFSALFINLLCYYGAPPRPVTFITLTAWKLKGSGRVPAVPWKPKKGLILRNAKHAFKLSPSSRRPRSATGLRRAERPRALRRRTAAWHLLYFTARAKKAGVLQQTSP